MSVVRATLMVPLLLSFGSAERCFYPGPCHAGQLWNQTSYRCESCTEGTFMDQDNHQCTYCLPCTRPDNQDAVLAHKELKAMCTTVADTSFQCMSGYEELTIRDGETECYRCAKPWPDNCIRQQLTSTTTVTVLSPHLESETEIPTTTSSQSNVTTQNCTRLDNTNATSVPRNTITETILDEMWTAGEIAGITGGVVAAIAISVFIIICVFYLKKRAPKGTQNTLSACQYHKTSNGDAEIELGMTD